MEVQEIGIVDTRAILKIIMDKYGYDFSDYALTSFKRRLERIIRISGIKYVEIFISRLAEEKEFFEMFLDEILTPSTELFRDPSLWRWLRDEYLSKSKEGLKVLVPECVSGDELYTMLILLKETGLIEKTKVYAASISPRLIENIETKSINAKKIEVSIENYKRFQGDYDFDRYYKQIETDFYRDKSLFENVEFSVMNLRKDNLPRSIDIILFRNHLIYYNPSLQAFMIDKLSKSLTYGGLLLLGAKENIGNIENTNLTLLNESESVYRKK